MDDIAACLYVYIFFEKIILYFFPLLLLYLCCCRWYYLYVCEVGGVLPNSAISHFTALIHNAREICSGGGNACLLPKLPLPLPFVCVHIFFFFVVYNSSCVKLLCGQNERPVYLRKKLERKFSIFYFL